MNNFIYGSGFCILFKYSFSTLRSQRYPIFFFPYIFFWNWLSFVCACWIVFDCILEFWILCCEILDHIEILCRRLILFVCLTGSSLGWFQTAGPISLTVGIVPGSVNLQASAVLLWGCPIVPSPGVSHSPHSGCERAGSYPEQGISFLS